MMPLIYIKKPILAILALGCGVTFAGAMGPVCTEGNVSIACASKGYNVGIEALYLKMLSNNNNISASNTGSNSGVRLYKEKKYDFEWGFKLDGSYHFNTGNDLNLNWIHWSDGNKKRLGPTLGTPSEDTSATVSRTFFGNSQFDAVNLELGQQVNFGQHKNVRIQASVQYARIDLNTNVNQVISGATGALVTQNGTLSITDNHKYSGVGPRIGSELSYDVHNNFAIYGNAAAALLVGTNSYSNNAPDTSTTRPVRSSYTSMVPELEAKIGAKYTHDMARGHLTFDVGYMAVNYFNALHRSDLNLVSIQEYRENFDFGLFGPYAGLKWVGNL